MFIVAAMVFASQVKAHWDQVWIQDPPSGHWDQILTTTPDGRNRYVATWVKDPPSGRYQSVWVNNPVAVDYPLDVYPFFWEGLYYYPYWTGAVWGYRVYSHPHPHWGGPPLRNSGPAPRYFGGGSHHGNSVMRGSHSQHKFQRSHQQVRPPQQVRSQQRSRPAPSPQQGGGHHRR
jgi:hypothetical protein